ncbi:MAG: OB-fold nucleic acid binding domain-containing protein, partial [Minisyncoccia bacterium]
GLITSLREVTTKKNERMTFLGLEDLTGELDVVVFPSAFEEFKVFLVPDNCIAIKGKISKRNGETSLIADKIKSL